eukprot:CAMPEP_0184394860 /NCGR_PEP_ID=MMETSP0007-20130409/41409_1 /TAXON_ID=97485 /ORGANISM="Prymnesium parvum, Strain Texoma1" /LENGTH=39 /DNA_ID= /DNA_START= /DNA_END= /DNA_ORIENTATION=
MKHSDTTIKGASSIFARSIVQTRFLEMLEQERGADDQGA